MSEKNLQNQVFVRLNSRRDVRVFRNNVGVGFMGTVIVEDGSKIILGNARRIRFVLHEGSADLIGWKSVKITPDMVGKTAAVFISVEIKTAKGVMSKAQKNWLEQVRAAGGIAIEAREILQVDKI